MQIFKDYVDLLVEFDIDKARLTAILGDNKKLLRKFYEGIANESFKNEDDAAAALYGVGVTHSDTRFRTLKKEFKKRLQQLILILDFNQYDGFSPFQKSLYTQFKNVAAFKILRYRVKRAAAFDLAKTILEESELNGLPEAMLWSGGYLRNHYSNVDIDDKKYAFYSEKFQNALDYQYAESKAEFFFEDLNRHFILTKSTKRWLKPKAVEYAEILDGYGEVNSPFFITASGLVHIYQHLIVNDYKNALPECNKFIAQLEARPALHKVGLAMLLHQKMTCCLMLKEFDEGLAVGLKSREMVIEGQHNWFNNSIILMQMHLHLKKYGNAWTIYQKCVQNKNYESQRDTIKETIQLYGAYLNWFVVNDYIEVAGKEQRVAEQFRFQRFMNDINLLNQDKQGMNIPILLLQILFLLSENRYETISLRLESLKKYKTRYVTKDENNRTIVLMTLLNVADKYGYNVPLIEKDPKVKQYHQILIDTVPEYDNPNHEVEILSYEAYWELMLEILHNNVKQSKKKKSVNKK
jgi:hypothetical protein